ncbi:MAG: TonB-dependent receptor [Bacteroidota bacterium]|nr:TonB-dependent receptor [Bacteroidota bacterium]MDP4211753.1 TonB-dependent receptor [Bacteroidota bacterium]MDP4251667.1 TonB-dependent receptor [Bacteroidota bacterium]
MKRFVSAHQTQLLFYFLSVFLMLGLICLSDQGFGQTDDSLLSPDILRKLSLKELMNMEVTSVSKTPEKLTEAASAIQVITGDDIRRSGATTLPEALRLATNLQVAQVNASQWAISARGFNNVLADKLLVMIDGRTVYTPLYAGVFWDVQNVLLEDVDRIEVISGPGGTLWGANAVNGVINIITKNARETQGLFAQAGGGNEIPWLGNLRYGGTIGENINYRVYGMGYKRANTSLTDGSKAKDAWSMGQGGFRFDWDAKKNDHLTLQSDFYDAFPNPDGATGVVAIGGNVLGRWTHRISDKSDFRIQGYYDQTWRDFLNGFTESLKTYDIDWQYRLQAGRRQELIWGGDVRLMDDKMQNLALFAFLPAKKMLHLYSLFVQDKITLVNDRLYFTLGSKLEHNDYTGFEYSPSGRLAWTPAERQMIWAAVSRAVRTPSRIDRDFSLSVAPGVPVISGDDFISETVLAYELGWRVQPFTRLSLSIAGFYNVYDHIRSAEPGPPPAGYPITFGNGVRGNAYGAELSGTYQPLAWWRLRGGYTFLKKDLSVKPGSQDLNKATAESNDPENQFLIQSMFDLPARIEAGFVFRYVDKLPDPIVPAYTGLDIQLGWKMSKGLELSVTGQNLLQNKHAEFIPSSPSPREILRSVNAKLTCRF